MPSPIPYEHIRQITDQASFVEFLRSDLAWPIPDHLDSFDPVAVPYDMFDDLGYKPKDEPRVQVSRLLAMQRGQPWGVFLFKLNTQQIYITDLRKIVRKLSSRRELMRGMPIWKAEHILIIATADWQGFQFLHLRGGDAARAEIHSFGWQGPDDGFLRTLCEFNLPRLRMPEIAQDLFGEAEIEKATGKQWIEDWQAAFDIKAVTDAFYQDLSEVFTQLHAGVKGVADEHHRHIAELLVNRLLFLSFVQKKGWLDGNPDYLYHHYSTFKSAHGLKHFYKEFLHPLFFDALNNAAGGKHPLLGKIPFLNGGLFTPSEVWDDADVVIAEPALTALFERLLHRYNFTIRETDPLDVVVAFDQDLLGYGYEELIAFRHGQGAYYTHPTEVYLMCRESLRAYLQERTEVAAEKIGRLAYGDEDVKLTEGQAFDIYKALFNVRVCDIAQGSGSFSVAMLKVLFKAFQIIAKNITDERLTALCHTDEYLDIRSNYQIKLHIIERSIYGCDIDEFAVEITRLRFWIELMVEMSKPEPLPNFDFKFLTGDALVSYWERHSATQFTDLDTATGDAIQFGKESLQALALAKRNFFMAGSAKEKRAARNAIRAMRLIALRNLGLKHTPEGDSPDPQAQKHVHWKLDFAEIFAEPPTVAATAGRGKSSGVGDPGYTANPAGLPGFDIMIANPPYVRQELIEAGFREFGLGISKSDLITIYQKLTGFAKLNAKSDLYVYFFYRALMLLKHEGGIFCFICSNSWLDVGYGAQLQEYILKHCEIRAIIDNSAKRSFASADVNTTINLFVTRTNAAAVAAMAHRGTGINDPGYKAGHRTVAAIADRGPGSTIPATIARFIAFRRSFEDAATEPALRKALALTEVTSTSDYRVYPIAQDNLFTAGLEQDTDAPVAAPSGAASAPSGAVSADPRLKPRLQTPVAAHSGAASAGSAAAKGSSVSIKTSKTIAKYGGDKWGGKYLRAPDILFRATEKTRNSVIRMRDIATVRFGLKTGCNEFFHLPNEHFGLQESPQGWNLLPLVPGLPLCASIPMEFIRPVIFSLKEMDCILDKSTTQNKHVLLLPVRRHVKQLPLGLQKYISWGESKGFHLGASCCSRNPWYSLDRGWRPAPFIFPSKIGERMVVTWNRRGSLEDKKLYGVTPTESEFDPYKWLVVLNSSWLRFQLEMTARQLTGAQAIADVDVRVVDDLLVVDPSRLDAAKCRLVVEHFTRKVESCFIEFGLDKRKEIETQTLEPKPDRNDLDNIVFEALGLDRSDRAAVYIAIATFVKQRLDKAESV